jgi:hypothetical protein
VLAAGPAVQEGEAVAVPHLAEAVQDLGRWQAEAEIGQGRVAMCGGEKRLHKGLDVGLVGCLPDDVVAHAQPAEQLVERLDAGRRSIHEDAPSSSRMACGYVKYSFTWSVVN